jgi:hypothetical protein
MTEIDLKEQPGQNVDSPWETVSPYHDSNLKFDPTNLHFEDPRGVDEQIESRAGLSPS